MTWMVLTGGVFLATVVVASLFLAALHYADSIAALVGAVGLTVTLGALGVVFPLCCPA
ncbi:MAG: hypothetical protein H6738_00735 [Alphaproteobacteria bacterium]|nr:hypothetical protein [Alphaproteobacteria bacterium]MCB9695294.1 hypothetical protein [Alphaproteobacteria bacterium]